MAEPNDADRQEPLPPPVGPCGDSRDRSWKRDLESLRAHLTRVAGRTMGPELTSKVSASDLVQETFLAARASEAEFRGHSAAEWRGWLRAILRNRVANVRRYYFDAQKRQLEREVPLEGSPGGGETAAGSFTSPSENAMRHERESALRAALERLPEHYRLVVMWHHEEQLTFEQIATRMGISDEAARKVWARALLRLKDALGAAHDPR